MDIKVGKQAIQDATAGAAEAPLEVARRSAALLGAAVEVIEHGNPNAASDGAAAASALHAAVLGAAANVDINAVSLKDAAAKGRLIDEAAELRTEATDALQSAARAFQDRLG